MNRGPEASGAPTQRPRQERPRERPQQQPDRQQQASRPPEFRRPDPPAQPIAQPQRLSRREQLNRSAAGRAAQPGRTQQPPAEQSRPRPGQPSRMDQPTRSNQPTSQSGHGSIPPELRSSDGGATRITTAVRDDRPAAGGRGATGVFPAAGGYQDGQPPRGYAGEQPGGGGRGGRRPPPPPPGSGSKKFIDYPRWGRTGFTRWLPSWRLISAFIGLGFLTMVAAVLVIYTKITIPTEDASTKAQTTTIMYANGDVLAKLATQDREIVELAQIPRTTQAAVLAAEDRTFRTNSGVDPKSIARAVIADVKGGNQQGGSTISQQYVKNVYDQRDKTYKRKITEIFLAVKVNKSLGKDKILERYLNTIYLGRGAYGIQAAAHAYFGPKTDVSKLTVSQSAFLAGIINAPSLADPRGGKDELARATFRWNTVLNQMVKDGDLSAADRQKQNFPKTVVQAKNTTSAKGQALYLKQMVENELKDKLHLTSDQIETGGYKITTTFDKKMMTEAQDAVKSQLPKDPPKNLRVGIASIDPDSGAIKAIYGGRGFEKELNQAVYDQTQAGSTFKAFTLIAALDQGISLKNYYDSSSPLKLPGKKSVNNFAGDPNFGDINLITATEHSVNTVFARLNDQIGYDKTTKAAKDAGIPASSPDQNGNMIKTDIHDNLVNVLGPTAVHPVDLANAYATFAAGGIRHTPFSVISVTQDGKKVWKTDTTGKRVFSQGAVADLTYALQQVVLHGTASSAVGNNLGRPAAGKTGTASDSKGASFAGFVPQLSTVVAMHEVAKDGKSIVGIKGFGDVSNVTGGTFPARIWTAYMKAALQGVKVEPFPNPVYGGQVTQPQPTTAPPTEAPPTEEPTETPTTAPTTTGRTNPTGAPTNTPTTPTTTTTTPVETTTTGNGNGNGNGNGGGGGGGGGNG
jgi:membrane peptidoglycan carboxypeptidase